MSKRNCRVLHVVDHLAAFSGVASVVMLLITGIKQIRQDVAVYGRCDAAMEALIVANGGRVYRLPDVTERFGISFGIAFSQLLCEQPYQIVHGHLRNSAFIYLREAKRQKIPNRIIHAHSAYSADVWIKKIRNDFLSAGISVWANGYIAVSRAAAENAFGKTSGVSVIHNGTDTDRFRFDSDVRHQTRRELGISDNTLCVGNVARFVRLKNHTFLLDVFLEMLRKTDCVLVMAGAGPLEDLIKAKVREAGLSESVRFLGVRQDVEHLYQAFDVFLLPSLSEGLGVVTIEAQCSGLGCVVSNAVPKEVACGENIHFLALGDTQLWAKIAIDAAKQPRINGSDGVKAAKLDVETMCSNVWKIYERMMGEVQ